MHLQNLLAALEQPPTGIYPGDMLAMDSEVTALTYDSRKVVKGTLFIAVPGVHTDGWLYIKEAAQRGAIAALGATPLDGTLEYGIPYIGVQDVRIALANLACAFYSYPAQQLCTIGVTGTDGKTTTSNLISMLLEHAGKQVGLMTTANFRLAGKEWENLARQSTLEALEVQQFLHRLLEAGGSHAVIEATSHGLALQRVRGCNFDVGVVTNITHEHLDFHKTIDAYRRAKASLFEMLDPARDKGHGYHPIAILNRDDSSYEVLKPYCRTPILGYGIDTPAAVRAVDSKIRAHSTRFRVILPDNECMVETPLVGRFNISNCLAAIATAYSQGVALETIVSSLATIKGVAGRMERIDAGQPFTVIVDYAHTPDSLEKVLAILRPVTAGKLIVVFGSAGERDVQKRPVMGSIAAKMTDFFVITDEDPREEDREAILGEIATGAQAVGKRQGRDFLCIANRTQAIAAAFARAKAGDTVLLAGKGHEQSILIGREKLPWDDRQVAREQLRARK
jgi:UDP-N-acetylmuramoyl-L-alanyl-D-glutamate--2,6-diaminopimelate ligase